MEVYILYSLFLWKGYKTFIVITFINQLSHKPTRLLKGQTSTRVINKNHGHRCAIPARINQYQYLILKNQVSIPISISIFQISEIDTDFNTNTPDLENQYRYQYQYLSFENSITIPISILKILSVNINLDLNTKVLQYSEWKNFQLPAVN